MSKVKDVIDAEQPIPADVTEFTDCDGRPWSLSEVGHWHTSEDAVEACAAGECYEDAAWKMLTRYMPLTVTAVRQPEPERTLIGPPHAHLDAPCTDKCYETASAEPEPQQADTSALLDLVRQYGGETQRLGSAHHGGSAQVVEEYTSRAKATFDRIAALVPQQPLVSVPLRERDELRAKLAESEISVAAMRRMLDTLYASLGVAGAGVEEALAEVGRLKARVAIEERAVEAEIAQRDENADWADRLVAAIAEHLGVEIGEHSNANLPWQAALHALEFTASTQPDPSVLSLPHVPDGATLIGKSGERYERTDDTGWWRNGPHSEYVRTLGTILDTDAPVTVVMREPRTWPKLTEEHADLPGMVYVERHGTWRRLALPDDRLYEQSDGFGAIKVLLRLPLSGLQLLGDVTEVFDNEPGGAA